MAKKDKKIQGKKRKAEEKNSDILAVTSPPPSSKFSFSYCFHSLFLLLSPRHLIHSFIRRGKEEVIRFF